MAKILNAGNGRFRTNYSNHEKPASPECSDQSPSLTVPGQAYGVRELMVRSRLGTLPTVNRRDLNENMPVSSDFDDSDANMVDILDAQDALDVIKASQREREAYAASLQPGSDGSPVHDPSEDQAQDEGPVDPE